MLTWSTADVPRPRQFGYWREAICEAFLDLTPESAAREGFWGRVTQRRLDHLDLARIESQAQRVARTERDITGSPASGYYANLQVRGECVTVQDGRTTVMRPGDLVLVDTSRPFIMDFAGDFRQLTFHVPEAALSAQVEGPIRTATRITTAAGAGAAIRHALHALDAGDFSARTAAQLAAHTCGLLAVACHAGHPDETSAASHHRLLRAALTDIDEHLHEGDLSPARTAARLGISLRLLHKLFAGHDHSYAAVVRQRRLEQAYRDLGDPERAGLRIIDVAVSNGFVSATHFHRAFRQRYGVTPAQRRREALPPTADST